LHNRQLLSSELAALSVGAVVPAVIGMVLGQVLRQRLSENMFRKVFFAALMLLGAYIVLNAARAVL
jgi:uncharacterized membrane protein YfcA